MSDPTAHATPRPLLLADLTSAQTRELLPEIELVLIPVGAHEQHGPGLPVSTDTVSADAICRAAASICGPRVAVAPVVPWGVSWHHMAFAGTISLRPATLAAVLEDVIGSLHANGFRRVLVVNAHGGNSATIATAIEQAKLATGMHLVASVFGYALIAEQARTLLPPETIGHAGADEAAVVLAAAPGLADASAFGPAEPTGNLAKSNALLRAAGGVLARPYHEVTRNGATGDSRPATIEIGHRIIEGAGRRLAEIAETLIAEDNDAPAQHRRHP